MKGCATDPRTRERSEEQPKGGKRLLTLNKDGCVTSSPSFVLTLHFDLDDAVLLADVVASGATVDTRALVSQVP